jgi:hypothetical protein
MPRDSDSCHKISSAIGKTQGSSEGIRQARWT